MKGRLSRIERYYAGVERTAERTVFTYDAYGRTQTVSYGTQRIPGVMETYEYYPSGQLFAKTLGVFGTQLRAEFTYDAEGRAYSTKYPGGNVVYVKYNEADRPKELWKVTPPPAPDELQASAEYDPRGWMSRMYGADPSWQQQWTYNDGGLMTGHSVGVNGNGLTSITYAYETAAPVTGKLASATQNGNTVNYAYDSLGRLTSATSTAWNQSYTYDGFSNLYQKTGSTGTMNWSHLLNSEKNQFGGSDAAGNAVGYTWDADNRLIGSASWQRHYLYDSSNQRVIELKDRPHHDPDAVDTYVVTFRAGGTVLGRYEYSGVVTPVLTTWKEFQYLGGRRTDIGTDRLGSNLNGGRVILPYGEELSQTPNGETKFATYWRDADTGLDYADQRYYSPGTGRFLSADPYLASGATVNPASWNRYAYVNGDPINYRDRNGLWPCLVGVGENAEVTDCEDVTMPVPAPGQVPGTPPPDPNREKAELELLAANSVRLQQSLKRIRENMTDDCAKELGAADIKSAKARTELKIFGISVLGLPKFDESGIPTRDSGPLGRYRATFQGGQVIRREILLNGAVNWEDPSKTLSYKNGMLENVDLLGGMMDQVHAIAMTAEQFMDLVVLHELKHSFGGQHSDVAEYNRNLWTNCFK